MAIRGAKHHCGANMHLENRGKKGTGTGLTGTAGAAEVRSLEGARLSGSGFGFAHRLMAPWTCVHCYANFHSFLGWVAGLQEPECFPGSGKAPEAQRSC